MEKFESYLVGLVFATIIGFLTLVLINSILEIPYTEFKIAIFAVSALYAFWSGIRKIDPVHKVVATWLGSPTEVVLGDGYVWWLPNWFGGGLMDQVKMSKQHVKIIIGSTHESDVQSKDRVSMQFELDVWFIVKDPYTWSVLFGENPESYIRNRLINKLRDIASRYDAKTLVHLSWDNEIKEIMDDISAKLQLEAGAVIENVAMLVRVPQDLQKEWERIAMEEAQRIAERRDLETFFDNVFYAYDEIRKKGLGPRDAFRNALQTVKQRYGMADEKIFTLNPENTDALVNVLMQLMEYRFQNRHN